MTQPLLTCDNQLAFEVVRDIVTLMKQMKYREKVSIQIESSGNLFTWKCSGNNQPCGPSEAAKAMREGYESVFNQNNENSV